MEIIAVPGDEMLSAVEMADGVDVLSSSYVTEHIDDVDGAHSRVPAPRDLAAHLFCVGEGPATMTAQRIIAEM